MGVAGRQKAHHGGFQIRAAGFQFGPLLGGHLAHIGVVVAGHQFQVGQLIRAAGPAIEGLGQWFQVSVFLRQLAELVLVADHLGVGQLMRQIVMAFDQLLQAAL